jgi:cytochrome c1
MQAGRRAKVGTVSIALLALAACADTSDAPRALAGADPDHGRRVAERLACAACHRIPGIAWPQGRVGGSLEGFADRPLIAGRFPNQPDVLARWLRDAPTLDPSTGRPPMPMTAAEARDVAAYLYTLR